MIFNFVTKKTSEMDEIKHEIILVSKQIENATASMRFCNDSDLIDSSIYQLNALNARYRYLLRLAKNLEESKIS